MDEFARYLRVTTRLDGLIDLAPAHDPGPEAVRRRAVERFAWMSQFMASLGDPQHDAPVIHVTGTSGKGSTATAIESMLRASGLRTLLHTSPYLQVATEKLQIAGRLVSADELEELADEVIAAADRFEPGRLTYGEALMAIVLLAIPRFRPDVAIVEFGAGGRYDLSNVVRPTVAVITTVGIDHTESLGESIAEIAWHKAGIIKPGVHVVHAVEDPEAVAIVEREATSVGAATFDRIAAADLDIQTGESGRATWRDRESGRRLVNGIPGRIQAMNGAVAVAAARRFLPGIQDDAIAQGLAAARIPARLELMPGPNRVILDGAHNEQKMDALLADLTQLPRPRVGVIGFLASKRFRRMVEQLTPLLDAVVISQPEVTGKAPVSLDQMVETVAAGGARPVQVAQSTAEAIEIALGRAGEAGSVIVTGSMYLAGQAREQWYPGRAIVERQTQWPDQLARP